jgi:hypothetical protein
VAKMRSMSLVLQERQQCGLGRLGRGWLRGILESGMLGFRRFLGIRIPPGAPDSKLCES